MGDAVLLILALPAGLVLGALFYTSLWWTIRHGLVTTLPGVWFLASLLLRTAFAVAGFLLIAQGDWRRLLACLAGFMAARALLTRWVRSARVPPLRPVDGGGP